MGESTTPLVNAMRLIRTWPMSAEDQAAHIDRLIEAFLIEKYPPPEWIISLDLAARTLRVAKWRRVERGDVDLWGLIPDSAREIDCTSLEEAGDGWFDLAKSRMP